MRYLRSIILTMCVVLWGALFLSARAECPATIHCTQNGHWRCHVSNVYSVAKINISTHAGVGFRNEINARFNLREGPTVTDGATKCCYGDQCNRQSNIEIINKIY